MVLTFSRKSAEKFGRMGQKLKNFNRFVKKVNRKNFLSITKEVNRYYNMAKILTVNLKSHHPIETS